MNDMWSFDSSSIHFHGAVLKHDDNFIYLVRSQSVTLSGILFWGMTPCSLVAIKAAQELAASTFRVKELSACRPQDTGS